MRKGLPVAILACQVVLLACVAGCASTPGAERVSAPTGHGPLSGRPLGPGSGIRLLITGGPAPAILDVDTGVLTPVLGLPRPDPRGTLSAFVHGGHTVLAWSGPEADRGRLYLLKGRQARKLATGWYAFPASDGSGFWITDRPAHDSSCTVRKQDEDGRVLSRPRWSYCGALPFGDTPYGLHTRHRDESLLLSHDSLRTTARYPRIVAATSRELLVQRSGGTFALVIPGGKERPTSAPTGSGTVNDGAVSADGRYVAVPFLTPTSGAHESLDVWVLDTANLRWTQVPSMPVPVDVKTRRMRWAPDGRLVFAGAFVTAMDARPRESGYTSMIATWRPGEPTLSLRRLPVDGQTGMEIIAP